MAGKSGERELGSPRRPKGSFKFLAGVSVNYSFSLHKRVLVYSTYMNEGNMCILKLEQLLLLKYTSSKVIIRCQKRWSKDHTIIGSHA